MNAFLGTKKGELFCGDRYLVKQTDKGTLYVVIDAIGHGKEASHIAEIALQSIENNIHMELRNIIEACNSALSNTRGAVICFVFHLPQHNKAYYYCLGNVSCLLVSPSRVMRLNAIPGILGQNERTVTLSEVAIKREDMLLMYTDGAEEIKVDAYTQIQIMNSRHIVNTLSDKWSEQDDMCCICQPLYE